MRITLFRTSKFQDTKYFRKKLDLNTYDGHILDHVLVKFRVLKNGVFVPKVGDRSTTGGLLLKPEGSFTAPAEVDRKTDYFTGRNWKSPSRF